MCLFAKIEVVNLTESLENSVHVYHPKMVLLFIRVNGPNVCQGERALLFVKVQWIT